MENKALIKLTNNIDYSEIYLKLTEGEISFLDWLINYGYITETHFERISNIEVIEF